MMIWVWVGGGGFFNRLSPSHLVSVLVEEVEDSGEVVLHLAGAEQVEENEHVGHGWGEEMFGCRSRTNRGKCSWKSKNCQMQVLVVNSKDQI